MIAFDFVFTLFALLLGLSLAELFTGFSRALKLRTKVRVGWVTPLLGVFVIMDLTSFWLGAWNVRGSVKVSYAFLLLGVITTGLYYFAASLVFPEHPADWPNFDAHYFRHRRQVLAAVWLCNLIAFVGPMLLGIVALTLSWAVLTTIYTACVALAMLSNNTRSNIAALLVLIGIYLVFAFL